jgi:hypothetical protein
MEDGGWGIRRYGSSDVIGCHPTLHIEYSVMLPSMVSSSINIPETLLSSNGDVGIS